MIISTYDIVEYFIRQNGNDILVKMNSSTLSNDQIY